MASGLRRFPKLANALSANTRSLNTTAVRGGAAWNEHWKPGPYPTTDAEKAAAAKKYGLLPEDYKPQPDDGFGEGDYPDLPDTPIDTRDPYGDYDMPKYRRNYGEPLYSDQDCQDEARYNPQAVWPYSYAFMSGCFFTVVLGFAGLNYMWRNKTNVKCVFKQQYPFHENDGKSHYSFEKN